MPLPERLQPAKVNRQKLKQLADMAEEILAQIDNGAKEEDAGLKMLINDWNSQVINPYAFSDFRDFSSWTSAKDVSVQREPSGHNLKHPTKWCPPNK